MRTRAFRLFVAVSVWSLGTGALAATAPQMLESGSHCVAYRVEKVMFLVKSSMVVGKNCDVSAQVLPELGGLYRIEVQIPVSRFASGDEERDQDVRRILKADVKPELTFRSKAMSADQWRELFEKGTFDIDGDLTIGERSFPLKVSSKYLQSEGNVEVDGLARARFEDFDLNPPKVGGGMVVKAKPEIELNFHLQANRILGADSIKLVSPSTAEVSR